jgi:hypothetical protein
MRRLLTLFLPCLLSAQAVGVPARIEAFQTTAKVVRKGATVTLRWNATGADTVRLDPLGLILPARGEITHLVTGRTVYWLHVSNSAGGQSLPLVVDLVPEDQPQLAPAPPPIAVPQDLPRLAALPPVPAHREPALPAPRVTPRHATRRAWIQFAVTVSPRGAARLQGRLQRIAATASRLLVRHRHAGRPFHLIRTGPFPSARAARLRLRELAPAMKALGIRPIVIVGPPETLGLGTTFIADTGQPG